MCTYMVASPKLRECRYIRQKPPQTAPSTRIDPYREPIE